MDFLRVFLPIYFVLYLAAAMAWPTYRVWKHTGVNPYKFRGTDTAHDFIGQWLRLLFGIVAAVLLLYAFFPVAYDGLTLRGLQQQPALTYAGMALLLVSLGWTLAAQRQMGASWRIGFDASEKTALVREGVFAISRNPIFLGMRATLLGLLLTLPNAIVLAAFVLGDVLIQIQVRQEEEYLLNMHGDAYRDYTRHTRRWL